jgi:putative membrane protein
MNSRGFHCALLGVWIVALILSAIGTSDVFTWALEAAPAVIGVAVLAATYRRFPFTNLVYTLILIHSLILMLGGHYTYAKVPLGFWMQDAFHFSRNHYDRIGHFAQGFGPAIIAREIFIRRKVINGGAWRNTLTVAVCLAISALYELLEWRVSVTSGSAADAFLGTQGDVWDTQWDMFFALTGSITALALLGRIHDKQLEKFGRLVR